MFDTHCHLNFQAFEGRVENLIRFAKETGVNHIVIPGTDLPTSKKAIEIAEKYEGVYAAVGIHPHHVFKIYNARQRNFLSQRGPLRPESEKNLLPSLSKLLTNQKVVAIGEVGIDRHYYEKTKHKDYKVDEEFVDLQKEFFIEQVKLAIKYEKALIVHNREAKKDVLEILEKVWEKKLEGRVVFHCCEPDEELLEFARGHKMFIGVDGDLVYWKQKQEFIKKVPLEMLVLETDSPYLSPFRKFPNEPKNIAYIAEFVAKLRGITKQEVVKITTENAIRLFNI
ncbi:TatD family hydrolase [Candidatus Roizmanbacteria bacterium]|nr:TatD family hydrolase [Candidatus Roizmanbacteria bacterium]